MNKLGPVKVGGTNPVRIMGILNTSPESFYKKSVKTSKQSVANTVKTMENQGADFVDVGGMSTAPYLSTAVSEKIETQRVLNAIRIIQQVSNLPISVDTCRASVAKHALENGVDIINDISGLKFDKDMISVVEKFSPSVILCAFSKSLVRGDHVKMTRQLLKQSISLATKAKISKTKIVLDPAVGFFRKSGKGKFYTKINSDWFLRDLLILENLKYIKQGQPILVSVSNKSFIGKIIRKNDPKDRIYGSIAAEAISVLNGADIIRTHNVEQTKDAVRVAKTLA